MQDIHPKQSYMSSDHCISLTIEMARTQFSANSASPMRYIS